MSKQVPQKSTRRKIVVNEYDDLEVTIGNLVNLSDTEFELEFDKLLKERYEQKVNTEFLRTLISLFIEGKDISQLSFHALGGKELLQRHHNEILSLEKLINSKESVTRKSLNSFIYTSIERITQDLRLSRFLLTKLRRESEDNNLESKLTELLSSSPLIHDLLPLNSYEITEISENETAHRERSISEAYLHVLEAYEKTNALSSTYLNSVMQKTEDLFDQQASEGDSLKKRLPFFSFDKKTGLESFKEEYFQWKNNDVINSLPPLERLESLLHLVPEGRDKDLDKHRNLIWTTLKEVNGRVFKEIWSDCEEKVLEAARQIDPTSFETAFALISRNNPLRVLGINMLEDVLISNPKSVTPEILEKVYSSLEIMQAKLESIKTNHQDTLNYIKECKITIASILSHPAIVEEDYKYKLENLKNKYNFRPQYFDPLDRFIESVYEFKLHRENLINAHYLRCTPFILETPMEMKVLARSTDVPVLCLPASYVEVDVYKSNSSKRKYRYYLCNSDSEIGYIHNGYYYSFTVRPQLLKLIEEEDRTEREKAVNVGTT